MKDYEHVVIWLDYFNKTLPQKMGRRVSRDKSIFDPSLKELVDAAKAAGFEPTETNDLVRFPRRPYVRSGYIVLPKTQSKSKIISTISEKLVARRAKQSK
jgi:signal recognition particle subunit SRP19